MSSSEDLALMVRAGSTNPLVCMDIVWKSKRISSQQQKQQLKISAKQQKLLEYRVLQFVLNPLASGEVVLTETESQLGVFVCDIGGGTTDLAIYINSDIWHTMVISVGGSLDHI